MSETLERRAAAEPILEDLVASSPGVLFAADLSDQRFVLTYVSPNATRLLGYTPEALIESPWLAPDRMHPEERDRVLAEISSALEQRDARVAVEHRQRRADGTFAWIFTVAQIDYGDSGPCRACGYMLDVTDRKGAEDALRQGMADAKRANLAKSEFLSRMSHELRTPLNAILGFAQILEINAPGAEYREAVGHILGAGRHLLDLINEVLDIARIEAGRLTLSLEPVGVMEVVRESMSLVRPQAVDRNIHMGLDTSGASVKFVLADHQRLKQVLANLLSNAVKYNRDGGAVTVVCEDAPDECFRISVRDTGRGMSEEELDRLFAPFERLGAGLSGVEGTGLGLVFSRYLVEAMEGTIGVESRLGEGSTFWVTLQRTQDPVAQLSAAAPPSSLFQSGPILETRPVLYIEDNQSNLALVEHVLVNRPAVQLITAVRGEEGLELAQIHQPALILLDLHLPDISGAEVLRRLREDPTTQDIAVVVISADATPGKIRELMADGAIDYLTKPIDVKRLLKLLDEVLDGVPA